MMTMRERYNNDLLFSNLVDVLVYHIEKGSFTPTETREAAMLAQIIYEDRHPRPVIFNKDHFMKGAV